MQNQKEGPEESGLLRLNRFLAQSGLGSRRKCDEIIAAGNVFVNGVKVTELGTRIDPAIDKVEYHGKVVKPVRKLEYIAYYKPREAMVTRSDPEGRRTVYDSLREIGVNADYLNYVGRLDYYSEGLLLLTNDGDMIHGLTHPRFHIKKVYQVRIDRPITPEDRQRMLDGIESQEQILHAGDVRSVPPKEGKDDQVWYELDLYEGKNRQVRRMFEALGYSVKRLRRIQFGAVKLGDLEYGKVRHLTEREISAMKHTGYKNKSD